MRYTIFENGEEINVIESSPEFVAGYCEKHGYTYQEAPLPAPEPVPEPEPEEESSVWDELAAAYTEGVNSAYEQ